MESYGHFGRPSWFVAGLAVAALLAHFALPYGVVDYRGPASPDSDVLSRADVAEQRDVLPGELLAVGPSPTMTLAGALLAVMGGVLLLVLGYQPLQVNGARWIGFSASALACVGAGMMWMSSLYAVGTGFATLLGTILGTEFLANYWAISPVVVAGLSGWLVWEAGKVMTKVVSSRDGLRDAAVGHHRSALGALALMGTVLVVPWSIGLMPDGISDAIGIGSDEPAPYFFSAEDVQSVTAAEGSDNGRWRFTQQGDFAWLSFSITALVGASWFAFLWHLTWPAAAVHVSTGAEAKTLRTADGLVFLVWLGWLVAGVGYLLAWFLFAPNGETEFTFLPGFFPLLVAVAAWFLLRRELPALKTLFGGGGGGRTDGRAREATRAADFDA